MMRTSLFIFLLYCLNFCVGQLVNGCEKEIPDDVCPQHEGYDPDCESRCRKSFPIVIGSGCQIRNTGALLSLFGIRSFQCKCLLPPHFCVAGGGDPMKLSFSLTALQIHSNIVKLKYQTQVCQKELRDNLICEDQFATNRCDWHRSPGADWFEATSKPNMSVSPSERPTSTYLAAAGRHGIPTITLSTCDGLCSTDSVVISARIWRAPWITAELCFKENDSIYCAPIAVANGQYINETIPQTDRFQILFKFNNVSASDVVLLDDVSAKFTVCPKKIVVDNSASVDELPARRSGDTSDLEINRIMGPTRSLAANTHRIRSEKRIRSDIDLIRKRLCKEGECTTIHQIHQPSSIDVQELKCAGRIGILQCRNKCRDNGEDGSMARCIRQRDYPYLRRCVCQARRSPQIISDSVGRRVTIANYRTSFASLESRVSTTTQPSLELKSQSMTLNNTTESEQIESNEIVPRTWTSDETVVEKILCGADRDSAECGQHCRTSNPESVGVCVPGPLPKCECSVCNTWTCDFESSECGWTDLRLLSAQFNNISVAAKKDKANRYGLSQMIPASYSGLLRRGKVAGPVHLSVDVYPSESIDVRICVDSLYKCQSQTVAARAWNRVSAKIKVSSTDKIFLLFYNSDKTSKKTIAIDNITLKGGPCKEPLRRRRL